MKKQTKLFVLLLVLYIGLGLPDSLLSTTWPNISEDLEINLAYISLFSMIAIFFSMLSSNSTFKLNRIFGAKNVIIGSMVLCLTGIVIFTVFRSFASLIIVQMIMGFGAGAIDSNVNFIASQKLKVGQINLLHGFWGVGITITPLLTSALYTLGYDQWAVFIAVGFLFVLLITYSLIYQNLLTLEPLTKDEQINVEEKANVDWLGLSIYFIYGVEFIIGTFLASFLVTVKHLDPNMAALVVACYWGALMVSRIIMPLLFRYFHSVQILQFYCLLLIAAAPFIFFSNIYALAIGYIIIGYCFGPIFPTFVHFTECVHPTNTSYYISKQISSMYLSIFIAQVLIGIVSAKVGLGFYSLLVFVLIYILVILIFVYLRTHRIKLT